MSSTIEELENTILSQIEALGDNDLLSDPEDAKQLIDRSRAMAELTNSYIEIQKTRLEGQKVKVDAVRAMHAVTTGNKSEDDKIQRFLGIEGA